MSVSVPTRGRRHPISIVTQARALAAQEWKPQHIVDKFASDGVTVSLRSVMRWTDPKIEEADRLREQARRRRRSAQADGRIARHITRHASPEFKMARVRALAELHLGCRGVAAVMEFDFGDQLTNRQIEYALQVGHYPRNVQKVAA